MFIYPHKISAYLIHLFKIRFMPNKRYLLGNVDAVSASIKSLYLVYNFYDREKYKEKVFIWLHRNSNIILFMHGFCSATKCVCA